MVKSIIGSPHIEVICSELAFVSHICALENAKNPDQKVYGSLLNIIMLFI